ncbi:MAG: TcpQ domain-containing protein [Vicinamibacterales bacterium]
MKAKHIVLATLIGAANLAHAQQGISVSSQPYAETALPIAPAVRPAAAGISVAGYSLQTGEPIHTGLQAWAAREGWEFIWHPATSWKTLRGAQFPQKDLVAAVAEVVTTLRDEGKPLQLRVSEGNQVLEVFSTELKND